MVDDKNDRITKYEVNDAVALQIMQETLRPMHVSDPTVVRFIGNYVTCRDVPQASRLSGIKPSDGRNLLARTDIWACVQKLTAEQAVKFGYDAHEVVERVKEIAAVDPVHLSNADGTYIKNINKIPPEVRRAIKSLKVKNIYEEDINGVPQYRGEIISYEFWDKLKGLELLAREKDTFKKTTVVEHDVSKNARNILLAGLNRAEKALEAIDVTPVKETLPEPLQDAIETTPLEPTKPLTFELP